MGWLSQLLGAGQASAKTIECVGGGEFDIVGESNYQSSLNRLAGGKSERGANVTVSVFMVPEPSNRYDRKAVAAYIDGVKVGYLAREHTAAFHKALSKVGATQAVAEGAIVGGWRSRKDEGSFGVKLNMAWPPSGPVNLR